MAAQDEADRPARSRDRRPRNSLTPAQILDAAEAVAAHGEAVTVRAVAEQLGASAMALYRYFPTKDALVDALLDRVLARVLDRAEAQPEAAWRDELRALALTQASVLDEHPWVVGPLFASPSPGRSTVLLGERYLGILARGGLTGVDAVAGFTGILAILYGRTAFASADPGAVGIPLDPDALPRTTAVAADLAAFAGRANLERVLDVFLAGLPPA